MTGASRAARVLGILAFAVLAFLLVRAARSADVLPRLAAARPLPIAAGALVYALSFAARALRLQLLLPRADRPPFARAWAVSAASTFLLQVLPFRSGEVAGWAAFTRVLGTSWARAGAVFALTKVVDTASLLLVGLAGAAALSWRASSAIVSAGTAAALLLVAAALLVLPRLGAAAARRTARARGEGSRTRRIADEVAAGLATAADRPAAYHASLLLALLFFAGHLVALRLMLAGIGAGVSFAAIAFASVTSVAVSGLVPSPAGTFGPMESGFAAGLLLDGIPLAEGAFYATFVHVVATAAAGLAALPLFLSPGAAPRDGAPPPAA